jgi:hypothetical protein
MSLITIVTVISDFQGTYQQLALIICFSIPEKQRVQKQAWQFNWCPDFAKVIWKHEAKKVALCLEAEGRHFEHLL